MTLIASAAVCSPAAAAGGSPTIVVRGDSVVATSLPSFGQTTIEATRPDAITGQPVVIGQYSAFANPFTPFSVNTTTPTPLNSSGDCWQSGAVSKALTPDLQPGDTINLTQAGLFGGTSSTTSVVVPPPSANTAAGPVAGCDSIAPWARNAVISAPSVVTGGPIAVTGVAQPLATAVTVSASDGSHASSPVSVTPAADGSWSATIPAARLAGLANGTLTVTPVVAVPDVGSGAPAHIAGVAATVRKAAPTGHPAPRGRHARKPSVRTLRSASSLTLAAARGHGITASFLVPAGATAVEVELLHGAKPVYLTIVRAAKAGSRQTVRLGGSRLSRILRRGQYTIAVKAGTSRSTFGPVRTHLLTIR
jgi:hypothetical protein